MVVHYAGNGSGCKYGTGTVSVWVNHSHIKAVFAVPRGWANATQVLLTGCHQRAAEVERRAHASQGNCASRRKQAW